MTPVSIRNRSLAESSAIQRQMKAAKIKALFDDVEAQLTDPVLLAMTKQMRDTVMSAPEFAEEGATGPLLSALLRNRRGFAQFSGPEADLHSAEGQALVDAGLVTSTIHAAGETTYWLTSAGRTRRAA